ncbi:MAG: histidinol dehydrogenase [Bacteroidales bacterium]|nr:histidinol dehydrogenase [Bacteroidales bacterium]
MKVYRYPGKKAWKRLLARPALETKALDDIVLDIIEDIKLNGDEAVRKYTLKFDGVDISDARISQEEQEEALKNIDSKLKDAIKLAYDNIYRFHKEQVPEMMEIETVPGVKCWQKPIAIERVGLYVPGGTAPLFSSVLMLAVPATIAGCKEIVVCSPPNADGKLHPAIIFAAQISGVKKIFKVGGVQAIAAMSFGTETIPAVYKIFGPGNQYVTAAKQLVTRMGIAIDMPAGPSEVAVLADEFSDTRFIASDLLSQAEHGIDSQVILITTAESIISEVQKELERQLDSLPRKELAKESLINSRIFLVKSKQDMMELVNTYAPEHLIISTSDADILAEQVINAGSVFIGQYTPESAGDYVSGTNHTLPTHGYAKVYSGVNMDSYYKKITFQKISKQGLEKIGPAIEIMADAEQLTAHSRAVSLRLAKNNK